MRTVALAASIMLTALASSPGAAAPVAVGPLTAEFRAGGLALTYEGVPVVKGDLLQVFSPTPGDSFSSGSSGPAVRVEHLADGGKALVARYQDTRTGFEAVERVELHPGARVRLSLSGRWTAGETPTFEWAAGRLWAYPLEGAALTGPGGAAVGGGSVPAVPPAESRRYTTLLQGVRSFSARGPAYTLTVTAGHDAPDLVLLDGRNYAGEWAQGDRYLWLGFVAAPMQADRTFSRSLALALAPGSAAAAKPASRRTLPATAVRLSVAQDSPDGPPLVIPQPKQASFTGQDYRLGPATHLYTLLPDDARIQAAVTELRSELGVPRGAGQWNGRGILVAVPSGATAVDQWLAAHGMSAFRDPEGYPEGYTIAVTPEYAVVMGRAAEGAFYGLQTLRQLVRARGGLRLLGCTISDWPSLRFRGAHVFVGRDALPFHRKLIDHIFSRYKMNQLVLECEYTRWDSHPEIAVGYSMPKPALRADIAHARSRFMEVTPLINALGHSEWIFQNGRNLDIAEDPASPHDYCPSNERSYAFMRDILGEAMPLFRPAGTPATLHIGHDEITMFGRFPRDAVCRAAGATREEAVTNLFSRDVQRLHDLAGRPRLMLWSDMLLHRSESSDAAANAPSLEAAQARRKALPAGTVVCDWHYSPEPRDRYVSLDVFRQAGFPAIATTWYDPVNISEFAHAAIDRGALGLLQSTWAGYDSREEVLRSELKQFTAFVLAAEYAWSGNPLPPDKLPYRPDAVFKQAWRQDATRLRPRPGWRLNLTRALNARPISLARVPAGPREVDGVRVELPGPGALMLAGRANPPSQKGWPRSVVLPVGRRAEALVFVHAQALPAAGKQVGRYVVVYADGKRDTIRLVEGDQIAAVHSRQAPWIADVAWSGVDLYGADASVYALRWTNPRPGARIRTIEVHADDPVAAPMLLAVTGIGGP